MIRRLSERGQTAVEFALVIPVMLMFVFGIFEVGRVYFNTVTLSSAARDGARAAAIHTGSTEAQIKAYATAAVLANAPGIDTDPTKLNVDVQPADNPQARDGVFWERGDIVIVTVTYPWSIGIPRFAATGTLTSTTQLRME